MLPSKEKLLFHSLIVLTLGLTSMLISFFYLDIYLAQIFKQPEFEKVYIYSREITNIGLSTHYFIIAIVGYVWARFLYTKNPALRFGLDETQREKIQHYSAFLFKCMAAIGLTLQLLKLLFGRLRPHASEGFYNANFDPISWHWHWHSFPSGHSQVLFTVGTVCALIWPKGRWFFLLAAFLFSLTRVSTHQHFLSDMIAGGLIGYLGVLFLWNLWGPFRNLKAEK